MSGNIRKLPVSGPAIIPSPSGQSPLRWSVPSCRLRKQRPAVMPSRPSFAPGQSESARGVVRPVTQCGTNCFLILSVPPASRAGRRHRQNRQRPLTLMKLVRSRSKKNHERAQVTTCSVVAARVAPSRPVRECALPLKEKTSLLAQIRVTLCNIKLAARKGNGRPGSGEPRETPLPPFYDAQCVLILRAREHRPRRHAPGCPHFAVE